MKYTTRMALTALAAITIAGVWTVAAYPAAAGTGPADRGVVERAEINPERGTAEIVNLRYAAPAGTDAADAALQFIEGHHELFKLDQPESELQLTSRQTDTRDNVHLRFKQHYEGLRVWGCEQIAHRNAAGELYLIAGQTIPTPKIKTDPSIDANTAASRATIALRDDYPNDNLTTHSELLIYPDGATPRLAYLVEVTGVNRGDIRWNVFIDAASGEVITKYNNIKFDGPTVGSGENIVGWPVTIQTYQIGADYFLIDATQPMFLPPVTNYEGVIVTYDNYYANGPTSVIRDPNGDNNFNDSTGLRAAVAAHLYAELTYEYFLNTHGRNSYDDAGSTVRVNVHDPAYVNNAYWNGWGINFADGDGTNWRPFSGSLDVVAHELAHGVTDYTANLIYTFQSGALNESYSDFFGAMVDRDEWLLGDEIRITAPGYLRNMQNPHLGVNPSRFPFGYQPAHMDEFVVLTLDTDNGGVHINSGIPNKVGYLVSTAASREAAEQIWYHTLANYLSESSNFEFWAAMTLQSASDLFGLPSPEAIAVADALDSVGLGGVAVVNPALYGVPVALGGTADTLIQLKNVGASTVTLLSASTGNPELSVNAAFPIAIAFGQTATIPVTFDATAMTSACDIGEVPDAVTFTSDDPEVPTFDVPVVVSVGYAVTTEQTSVFTTGCTALDALNNSAMSGLQQDGIPVMFEGALMLGLLDGSTKKAYCNSYSSAAGFATVDDYVSGTDGDGRTTQTVRISTLDSRVQGQVRYTYVPSGPADCDYYLVDYTLTNNCDTPLTILAGVYTDFDILGAGTNRADFDVARQMVYMRDAGDAVAAGWALLSGDARNLRAINNPAVVWNGLTDDEIYNLLNATTNTMSGSGDDWSVLLTFGAATLGVGDTAAYSAVLMQSNSGTAGLQARIDSIRSTLCPVEVTGDVNLDGVITSADIIYSVAYVFKGGFAPLPIEAAGDVNCDGNVTSADIIYLVNFVFKSGASPCDVCSIL